jgi:hypothetical protein
MCVSCLANLVKKTFGYDKPNKNNGPCVYTKEQLVTLLSTLTVTDINYNYVKSAINSYESNCHLFKDKILKLL